MKASEWISILNEVIEVCGDTEVSFQIIDGEVTLSAYIDIDEEELSNESK